MVGTGIGAQRGILIRNGEVLREGKAALNLSFVKEAIVDLDQKELRISFDGSDREIEAVKHAVREAGYQPV